MAGSLSAASCTRFSPTCRSPARIAWATSWAGWVFDTPTRVTSSGRRPTDNAAWPIWSVSRARLPARSTRAWTTAASAVEANERGEPPGRLPTIGPVRKEALRLTLRADACHLDVLSGHAGLDQRLLVRCPQVEPLAAIPSRE